MQGDSFKDLPVAGLESSSPLVRKFQPNQFGSHLLPAPFSRYGSVVAISTEASGAHFVVSKIIHLTQGFGTANLPS